jgi:hypothetical protein
MHIYITLKNNIDVEIATQIHSFIISFLENIIYLLHIMFSLPFTHHTKVWLLMQRIYEHPYVLERSANIYVLNNCKYQ